MHRLPGHPLPVALSTCNEKRQNTFCCLDLPALVLPLNALLGDQIIQLRLCEREGGNLGHLLHEGVKWGQWNADGCVKSKKGHAVMPASLYREASTLT